MENFLLGSFAIGGLKIGILLFLSLYLLFSFIVVKQVKVMTETLEVGFEKQLKILAYLHLGFNLFLLVVGALLLI